MSAIAVIIETNKGSRIAGVLKETPGQSHWIVLETMLSNPLDPRESRPAVLYIHNIEIALIVEVTPAEAEAFAANVPFQIATKEEVTPRAKVFARKTNGKPNNDGTKCLCPKCVAKRTGEEPASESDDARALRQLIEHIDYSPHEGCECTPCRESRKLPDYKETPSTHPKHTTMVGIGMPI